MKRLLVCGLGLLLCGACGTQREVPLETLPSAVAERDGWVDARHALAADGQTEFLSSLDEEQPREESPGLWLPRFDETYGFDTGPTSVVLGDHLLSLSRFRGLVITARTDPQGLRLTANVPIDGLPVGLAVADDVAAVLVLDALAPGCFDILQCSKPPTSRVILVDVRAPASPRVLGEQRLDGIIAAARQVGSHLHVLTRELWCSQCEGSAPVSRAWLNFDRSDARQLPAPREVPLAGTALFGTQHLFVQQFGPSAQLRVANLSVPDSQLAEPVPLAGHLYQVSESGESARVVTFTPDRGIDLETLSLSSAAPAPLGHGSISASRLTFDKDRAVGLGTSDLALFDLSDPNAPRQTATLELALTDMRVALAGDRLLVAGQSTAAGEVPANSELKWGPLALALIDISDLRAPSVLDRVTLGAQDSRLDRVFELGDGRALLSYYDEFPGARAPAAASGADCGRSHLRLVGYDVTADRLDSAFVLDGIDARSEVVGAGDQLLLTSSVSVRRYTPAAPGASAISRLGLTRSVSKLRALSNGLALFGVDLDTNAKTLELLPGGNAEPLEVPMTTGLSRFGCEEDRQWEQIFERAGKLYAVRLHRAPGVDGSGASALTVTLHPVDAASGSGADSETLDLPPLAADERYLGAVQTANALLVARGRLDDRAPDEFPPPSDDPTLVREPDTSRYWDPRDLHPQAKLGYDVVDLTAPTPQLAARYEVDSDLVQNGLLHFVRDATLDAAWGFPAAGTAVGPMLVDGSSLFGQHVTIEQRDLARFYLDRFDFADPSLPQRLEPVNIPGNVLDFDAGSGALLTLQTLWLDERAGTVGCRRGGYDLILSTGAGTCRVKHRALNGLILEGGHARRVGQLLLDGAERRVVRFAVSDGRVYYLTQARSLSADSTGPFAARTITLEQVVLRDGQLERSPSLDISEWASALPEHWQHFVARGERALWVSGSELGEASFRDDTAHVETHALGPWGCESLDLRDDSAYCARGLAGYLEVPLSH